jgi:hypothetical protein
MREVRPNRHGMLEDDGPRSLSWFQVPKLCLLAKNKLLTSIPGESRE